MSGPAKVDVDRARSAPQLIGATFELYRRYSWLFLILAGVVVVPYQLISLVAYPGGPLHGAIRALANLGLTVGDFALVVPLVSALHLYAIEDLRAGREPDIASVARRGLGSLRILSLAVLLSGIGIFFGFLVFIVPGVLLAIRWAVVAQAGALEATSWRDALHRSVKLTEGDEGHVFWLLAILWLIAAVPIGIHIVVFGASNTVGSFVVATAFSVLLSSFTALATAFLYYDLKARLATAPAPGPAPPTAHDLKPIPRSAPPKPAVPPKGDPIDPASWSDEDRPHGWYIDPDAPWNMRFWAADGKGVWSKRTAKTPKATLEGWKDLRWTREKEEDSG
jgi:hypothetical protein